MKVKIKKLVEEAVIPSYAKPGDAGLDLVATSMNVYPDYTEFGTGLSFRIPDGHVGLIFPRSSISSNTNLSLANAVAVIDSQYSGEVKLRFRQLGKKSYNVGDRIGQLIILPYPQIEFIEVDTLEETERGSSGFGSSGR